tara:strand:+ start:25556 stop:26032 length:477 start_codon:yes stop_codon:yes gene_type:complete
MNTTFTKIQDIMKRDGSFDGHMWIEGSNDDGSTEIFDYHTSQFEGVSAFSHSKKSWTGKLDYKPFPKEIEQLIANKMIKNALKRLQDCYELGKEEYVTFKKYAVDTPGMCNVRSVLLMDALKNKCPEEFKDLLKNNYKIRCGSLGFIQTNGDVFYEFG